MEMLQAGGGGVGFGAGRHISEGGQ